MNELLLFTLGIKPAILVRQTRDTRLLAKGKYTRELGRGILISHTPIPDDITAYTLGVALGYYPESCKRFGTYPHEEIQKGPFIFYNGLHFNTCGLGDEALKWCQETYGERMRDFFGALNYYTYLPNQQNDRIREDRRLAAYL